MSTKQSPKKSTPSEVTATFDEVARCVFQLLSREPFFGHFLGGLTRDVTEDTQTAAVGLRSNKISLMVNPVFFMKTLKTVPERVAVVKHEALHLLFKHLFRIDFKRNDPLISNLAADLVVNQLIGPPWVLPQGAILLSTFPDLKLEPNQTLEYYFAKLSECDQNQSGKGSKGQGKGQGQGQGQGQGKGSGSGDSDSEGEDESQQGGGGGGSSGGSKKSPGSGHPSPISKAAIDKMRGDDKQASDHSKWGEGEGTGFDEVAEGEIDRIVSQAKDRCGQKGWSNMPGYLKELIQAILERRQPKVDWRRALRIFGASSSHTRIKGTIQRVSKRYGTSPGIKTKKLQHIGVIVDTSGSVPDEALGVFFSEIHGMWRGGAQVTIIEADAAVQRVWEYRGRTPEAVGGRGGTNFDPAFEWVNSHRGKSFDGLIYLTDGGAPEPTIKPRAKLLWVVTKGGMVGPHLLWGRTLLMDE